MPKLIIKRENPQRFTWQAILFWVLGLLPVALLAGFLTGNLISQWQHLNFKAGQVPLLPLAPMVQPQALPPSSSTNLPLPLTAELPSDTSPEKPTSSTDTLIKPDLKPSTTTSKPLNRSETLAPIRPTKTAKKPAESTTAKSQSNSSINQANTKNQQNNRNYPVAAPSIHNKPVKSPQTVSESPRPSRPVARTTSERSVQTEARPLEAAKNERGSTNDYRLLEQSLGIPLQ
ncbi:hypothetical protein [uncultured Thiothrix sp.]|uniref:hypothetical protein n=1 Tax=uncultured Thiothrix sp. TaxID=223185 RepID=UPI00261E519F|nr:hypothetical protein [uncultured Thiothrix sp.]